MIDWLLRRFKNLRMKSQIVMIGFLILLVVLILVGVGFYVQNLILNLTIVNSSAQIIEIQDRTKISSIAAKLSNIVEEKFTTGKIKYNKVINQMQKLSQFYQVYEQHKSAFEINKMLEPCVPFYQYSLNSTMFQVPRFCYQASGVQDMITLPNNDENLNKIRNFVSLLDQYTLTLSSNFTLFIDIVALSPTKFVATFPYFVLIPGFDITTAPWYTEHVRQTQNNPGQLLVISPLRQSFFPTMPVPELDISYSILNGAQVDGYLGVPLFIDQYLIPRIPYNVMLLDIEGKLIFNYLENGTSLEGTNYIYDENITGFNQTDWQSIQQSADDQNILQLENKLSNQQVHVYALHIMQKNFTLIVYSNIQALIEIQAQSVGIRSDLIQKFTQYWLSMIIFWGFLISGQILILWLIFRPLECLSSIVKNHVLSLGNNVHTEMFRLAKQIEQDDNIFSKLQAKLLNVSDIVGNNQYKKNEICKRWEAFKYNNMERYLNLQLLKSIIETLPNGLDSNIESLKLILCNNQNLKQE